jgi:hypothetical protein
VNPVHVGGLCVQSHSHVCDQALHIVPPPHIEDMPEAVCQ